MDEQQLKDFIDQLKKILNDRSALKKKADELVASEKNIDAINKRTTQLKKAAGKDKDATDAVEKFTEEVKESVKQHKAFLEQTKRLSTAFKGLGRAAFLQECRSNR
jgi:DNA repair ATPase RecN